MVHLLDHVISGVTGKAVLFRDGWGDRRLLDRLLEIGPDYTARAPAIDLRWTSNRTFGLFQIRQGVFQSPMTDLDIPTAKECREGFVELVLPRRFDEATPIFIQFAATGDVGFGRRRMTMALPLVRRGIGSLILENPYYGRRRPAGQISWNLRQVVDLWAMCSGTIAEGRGLVQSLKGMGFRHIGVTGISMGGFMAATVGALSKEPLAIVPCLSPHSGGPIFLEGLLSKSCLWDKMAEEFGGHEDARKYFSRLLDLTDIRSLPKPHSLRATIILGARRDGFVPRESTSLLHEHWAGSELRWINSGHAGSFLFHRATFLAAIVDAQTQLRALAGSPMTDESDFGDRDMRQPSL